MRNASAIFFGSIGTLAETSEFQRRAYNHAFAEHGLDWVWDRRTYQRLLRRPGGRRRIEAYAADAGDPVDVAALHAAKVRHFARLARGGLVPRPGVADMLAAAKARGMRTALCSTTGPAQVDVVLDGLAPAIRAEDFDWIGDATHAARPKPAPDIYAVALGRLDLPPSDVLVVEDTPESAAAALKAGCRVLAFPGAAAADRDFPPGLLVVDRLRPRLLDVDGTPSLSTAAE